MRSPRPPSHRIRPYSKPCHPELGLAELGFPQWPEPINQRTHVRRELDATRSRTSVSTTAMIISNRLVPRAPLVLCHGLNCATVRCNLGLYDGHPREWPFAGRISSFRSVGHCPSFRRQIRPGGERNGNRSQCDWRTAEQGKRLNILRRQKFTPWMTAQLRIHEPQPANCCPNATPHSFYVGVPFRSLLSR
jgi:hypothetical protein